MGDAPEYPSARELGRRSMAAVEVKDREAWLDLFAEDGIVEDPIGTSPLDPAGNGHRGREQIAKFYDSVLAPNDRIRFQIDESFESGNECANVGLIRTTLPGGEHVAVVRGVYTYKSNGAGKLAALRSYWEYDQLRLEGL